MRPNDRLFLNLIVILVWVAASSLTPAVGRAEPLSQKTDQPAAGTYPADMRAFHLLSPTEGWLQLGEDLFWTHAGGANWQKITPPAAGGGSLQAVAFLDLHSGWAVFAGQDSQGLPTYQLAQTGDGGASWQVFPLSLFAPDDPAAFSAAVYLDFLSPLSGWMMVRQATSSAFSLGALFKTVDGGRSWTRLPAPSGDPVYFATDALGWVAGGPAGDQLYQTLDGGQTWTSQSLPGLAAGKRLYQLPDFSDPQNGILPVVTRTDAGAQVDFYRTQDGGQTWTPTSSTPLAQAVQPGTHFPLSLLDGRDWVLVEPGGAGVVRSMNGSQTSAAAVSGPLQSGITELDMVTPSAGWARYAAGDCQAAASQKDALACSRGDGLLQTVDGGQSWALLPLPQVAGALAPSASYPQVVTGQGFDTCDIPALSSMQTWWDHSPYKIFNLYIGGSALAGCGQLTAAYISQLTQQGWKFIVTWAGPQASCFPYSPRMSSDIATAYAQGVSEADLAINAAANLLLTQPDKTGSIIYYDLEGYAVGNSACRAAAKSFMDGWTVELQAKGNKAGVYGSGYSSALNDFWFNPHVPDGIWAAEWTLSSKFDPLASVWGLHYVPDNYWVNHQRLHQYAGGHNEAWGGVTFNVDCTVADGLALDLGGGPAVTITSPVNNAWLPLVPFTITLAAVDPTHIISKVVFEWHGSDWINSGWTILGTDTNGSDGWCILFDPTALPPQQGAAIYAYIYDSSGKRYSGAGVWNLGVDRPTVSSISFGPVYTDAPFRDFHVYLAGVDPLSVVASYDLQVSDYSTGPWTDVVTNYALTDLRFPGVFGHTYYFRARARNTLGILGAYTTKVYSYTDPFPPACNMSPDVQEPDGTPALAKPIPTDGTRLHYNFDVEGEQNWTQFTAQGWTSYTIQTANTGGHADTVLYLYGPDGTTLLASNDDYPGLNLASRVDWFFTASGTYYIKVVHWDVYAAGCTTQYDLSVTPGSFNHFVLLPFIRN